MECGRSQTRVRAVIRKPRRLWCQAFELENFLRTTQLINHNGGYGLTIGTSSRFSFELHEASVGQLL